MRPFDFSNDLNIKRNQAFNAYATNSKEQRDQMGNAYKKLH